MHATRSPLVCCRYARRTLLLAPAVARRIVCPLPLHLCPASGGALFARSPATLRQPVERFPSKPIAVHLVDRKPHERPLAHAQRPELLVVPDYRENPVGMA